MYLNKKTAVIVPCYNEARQIISVLTSMPDFVDSIYVVDDCSIDETSELVIKFMKDDSRVEILQHEVNKGVGGAILTGYKIAYKYGHELVAVMAGDGQMDPDDLEGILRPVAKGFSDYSKGNRFKYNGGISKIPKLRFAGNFILSVLTKFITGYWHVSDSQTGYTAINRKALSAVMKFGIYNSYGCPNDILVSLNIAELRVAEVPINPLYDIGEVSSMRIPRVILPIGTLFVRLFIKRMFYKYVVSTSHPLVLSYALSFVFGILSILLFNYCLYFTIQNGVVPKPSLIVSSVSMVLAIQFLLSSMEMDFSYNRHLCITDFDNE